MLQWLTISSTIGGTSPNVIRFKIGVKCFVLCLLDFAIVFLDVEAGALS